MSAHTPGPWTVTEHRFGSERWTSYFVHAGIATVAAMNGPCLLYDNAEADAVLIAAAPSLLAALRRAHACATLREDGSCDGCFVSEAIDGATRAR